VENRTREKIKQSPSAAVVSSAAERNKKGKINKHDDDDGRRELSTKTFFAWMDERTRRRTQREREREREASKGSSLPPSPFKKKQKKNFHRTACLHIPWDAQKSSQKKAPRRSRFFSEKNFVSRERRTNAERESVCA
jgi:hypothetical protein